MHKKEGEKIAAPVAGGCIVGSATTACAYAAVGQFGAASTGTMIASLGGASAKSATLAWFGGGAIAAGGGGVAVGTAVLATGGLAVAALAGYAIYRLMR